MANQGDSNLASEKKETNPPVKKEAKAKQKGPLVPAKQKPSSKKKIRWYVEDLDLPKREKLHAVAINYDVEKDRAPKIIATGRGAIAEKILKVAAENEVPLCSDPSLTDLLSKLEITQEIPPELYTLVAEVLAFVFQLNKLSKKGAAVRKKFAKKSKAS
ncbi:hypothetical protein HOG98_06450 [bacterium]|jgi:flagellar biosynthesis protein|nr:hypothetical protein [bacterium]